VASECFAICLNLLIIQKPVVTLVRSVSGHGWEALGRGLGSRTMQGAQVCEGESGGLLALCSEGGNSPTAAGCGGLEDWFSSAMEPEGPRG